MRCYLTVMVFEWAHLKLLRFQKPISLQAVRERSLIRTRNIQRETEEVDFTLRAVL